MSFTVTVLGSGSAAPTQGRGLTSQFIRCRGRNILIDCGEGTQMQIRRFGIKFQRIDHIFISHLHGDHYFGLVGLLSSMHLMGRVREIHIYGPEELKGIVESQLNYNGAQLAFKTHFHFTQAKENQLIYEDEKIIVHSFPLSHRVPTTGFLIREKVRDYHLDVEAAERDQVPIACYHLLKKGISPQLEDGRRLEREKYTLPPDKPKSYAFCSDTAFSESVAEMVRDVDLLYHEATFIDYHENRAKATMHSTARQAAQLAKMAGVKRLLMGHISARYDSTLTHEAEAREVFPIAEIAEDGRTYEVL